MPEPLTQGEISSQTDPSVSKQYDTSTPKDQQIKEFFSTVDSQKICMLNTYRNGTGPVGRAMGIAKRTGPDFLFLANMHSQKFSDLKDNKEVQLTFQDSKTYDWISVSGQATTTSNSDTRIKDLHSKSVSAWFGDLGDGKHDGSAEDPRMALIEVRAKHVVYWLHQVGTLGFVKEVGMAAVKGEVAVTGVLRELGEGEIERAREMDGEE
ncbi:hypothetical protein EJ04DRAFT_440346 [Polyplosphaeria fusca]|uniref:General stress protein FMN-binding split barrel domain-containing protein n=1 Tax=Polyplosphaeria fusca TaxID=682080 RepID=A0A9P4QS22_9PLEO|nr:hypothetical protein EJ04DRAFT_440346 [Polyplosphaeria fusca]